MPAPYRLPSTFRPLCERELVIERWGDRCHEWRHMETRIDWVGQGEPVFELVQRCHRGRVEMRRLLHRLDGELVCDISLRPLMGRLEDYSLLLEGEPLALSQEGAVRLIHRDGALRPGEGTLRVAGMLPQLTPLEELYRASVALLQMEGQGGVAARALFLAGDIPGARRCLDDSPASILLMEELGERCSEEVAVRLFEEGSGTPLEIRALRTAARMLDSKVFAAQAEQWDRDLILEGPEMLKAFIYGVRPVSAEDVACFDAKHRVETRSGTSFGSSLLTLQRAHVEMLLGHWKEGRRLLHLVVSRAGSSLLIPGEQGEPDLEAHAQLVQTGLKSRMSS